MLTENAPPIALFNEDGSPWTAYSEEAEALFARFTTPPTTARKGLINDLIVALKTAGVWTKLDVLKIYAAADSQAARQNWVQDLYNDTAVASPAFVADRGFTGDGSTSYLEPSFNPTTAPSPKLTQNDAHMGLWSRTNLANGAGTSFDLGSIGFTYLGRSDTTSGQAIGRVNTSVGLNVAAGAYPGHAAWARSGAALWEGYANGNDGGGGTNASTSLANQGFRVLGAGSNFGVNQVAAAHWGANLSPAETLATYNALNTYLQAVGAA